MDRKRKCPSKACYCAVLTAWLVIAVIVFLISSLLYLKPLFRGLRFRIAPCRVENSFYTTQFICHCGSDCKSLYPCVLIQVSFNASDGELWTVSLYKDEVQQQAVISLDEDAQEWCSLKLCEKDELVNHKRVDDFYHKYSIRGTPVQCAYDPWDIPGGAVLQVTPVTMAIFHALFWPFLCIMIGVISCVIFCRRCQQEDAKKAAETGTELTKVEEGKRKTDCNATSSQTGLISSDVSYVSSGRSWGRFQKHKTPKTADNKNTKQKVIAKSRAAKTR